MDITPRSKIMSKDEVALLIDLIQSNPVLNSKETNATTNKTKEDTWTVLASAFNAKSSSIPRTKYQLKLKWDNLKKAARKRAQQLSMNHLKIGSGKPDLITAEEILEKVSSLLGSTCTGSMVPLGGDGVDCGNLVVLDADNMTDIIDGSSLYEGMPNRKRKIEVNSLIAEKSTHFFGMPMSNEPKTIKKGKNKTDNDATDGRRARNLAIARYYDKRTEKLNLEMMLLKSELNQKENRNCNVINDI